MGHWYTSTTVPRPVAGDNIRHRGKLLPVKSVTLRSGSQIVDVCVDEQYVYAERDMRNDGWEFTASAGAVPRLMEKQEVLL